MQDHHTFACPLFALQNAITAGNMIPRWSPHARLGLNLGPSPFHARSMYRVLNLATGLVSPHYRLLQNNISQPAWYCDISHLEAISRSTPSRWHSNCQRIFGEYCQFAQISRRKSQSCMKQFWNSKELWQFSEHRRVPTWNRYIRWLQWFRELNKKSCAGFWGSYSHQLSITKCKYKLTWKAAQDVKGNGRISIATRFLWRYQDILHGFAELLRRPNQSRPIPW